VAEAEADTLPDGVTDAVTLPDGVTDAVTLLVGVVEAVTLLDGVMEAVPDPDAVMDGVPLGEGVPEADTGEGDRDALTEAEGGRDRDALADTTDALTDADLLKEAGDGDGLGSGRPPQRMGARRM